MQISKHVYKLRKPVSPSLNSLEIDVWLSITVFDKYPNEAGSYPDGAALDVQHLEGLVAILLQLLGQFDVHQLS